MLNLKKYISGALAALGLCLGVSTTFAGNSYFHEGDLILAFQNPGGATGSDKVVLVSLGNAAQLYRDQGSNLLNIVNIGSVLTNAFGSDWADQGTLYMGALSAWSNSGGLSTALKDGDPTRTVYVSAGRTEEGALGSAASVGWSGVRAVDLGTAAGRMLQVAANFQTGEGVALTLSFTGSAYAENNPFVNPDSQSTAYGAFAGGTQFQFGLGSFGSLGGIDAEGALDLYRFQARNDIAGQYGYGDPIGTGGYLGTLVIDGAGNVSFLAPVPEPGTVMLVGVAGLALLLNWRRRQFISA